VCDDEEAQMLEGSEFKNSEGSDAEAMEGKGCADSKNRQQIGVGGAQRT